MFEGVERGAEARLAAYLESAYQAQELATQGFLYRNFADIRPLGLRELHSRAALLLKRARGDRSAGPVPEPLEPLAD